VHDIGVLGTVLLIFMVFSSSGVIICFAWLYLLCC